MHLPGIGPHLAQLIIAYRSRTPFTSVDDLTNVNGIGPKKLDALRGLVTVHSSTTPQLAEQPAKSPAPVKSGRKSPRKHKEPQARR